MKYKGIKIETDKQLSSYTTFRIGGRAKYFITLEDSADIPIAMEFVQEKKINHLILGEGSNLLISDQGFDGLVVNVKFKGIRFIDNHDDTVIVRVAAGENWDLLIAQVVGKGLWGIENLSAIPGTAGALPVQNVGAYGQEASQVIVEVEVYDKIEKIFKALKNYDCQFGYRRSIFNTTDKGRYIISQVDLLLHKKGEASLKYSDLIKYFSDKDISSPTIAQMREAVSTIRDNKLPLPQVLGSAGSFFKNINLSTTQYDQTRQRVIKEFGLDAESKLDKVKKIDKQTGIIKIPTAFILDVLFGLKGLKVGGAKIYKEQALVVVNDSNQAKADDVMKLFRRVRRLVYGRIGIELQPEPTLIGFSKSDLVYYFKLD